MGISGIKQMFHTCKLWLHSNYLIGLIIVEMRNGLLSPSQTLPSDQCISVLVENEVAVMEI